MQLTWGVAVLLTLTTVACMSAPKEVSEAETYSEPSIQRYQLRFPEPDPDDMSKVINFPGKQSVMDQVGQVCVDPDISPPMGLFRRYICHVRSDRHGRRKRKPKPDCAFAQIGIRGVEAIRATVDKIETNLGLELDGVDFAGVGHNVMHQGIVYGDKDGVYDYSSGYYCGQPADYIGYKWYGWICQDPENLVQAYTPISNSTVALDNWIPRQYHLVDRKFNCQRMWRAEQLVAEKYDTCAHPTTSNSYRLIWRNCHSYVDDVVAKYDELEALETGISTQ